MRMGVPQVQWQGDKRPEPNRRCREWSRGKRHLDIRPVALQLRVTPFLLPRQRNIHFAVITRSRQNGPGLETPDIRGGAFKALNTGASSYGVCCWGTF